MDGKCIKLSWKTIKEINRMSETLSRPLSIHSIYNSHIKDISYNLWQKWDDLYYQETFVVGKHVYIWIRKPLQ